jgi:hypothetical protein
VPAYRVEPYPRVVQALTTPDERIWAGPHEPYVYLGSGRIPASMVHLYFPWIADSPLEDRLLADLNNVRPPLVICRFDELIFDQYLTSDWGRRLAQFLEPRYTPLDPSDQELRWVFVRNDRLAMARNQLAALRGS